MENIHVHEKSFQNLSANWNTVHDYLIMYYPNSKKEPQGYITAFLTFLEKHKSKGSFMGVKDPNTNTPNNIF